MDQLVRRLSEAERPLPSLSDGEVDAIVDPTTATPQRLSRAHEELLRSEARYRDLIARSPSIVCELAPDGTTLFANDAVRTVLGIRPAGLVGQDWWSEVIASEQRHVTARRIAGEVERQLAEERLARAEADALGTSYRDPHCVLGTPHRVPFAARPQIAGGRRRTSGRPRRNGSAWQPESCRPATVRSSEYAVRKQ